MTTTGPKSDRAGLFLLDAGDVVAQVADANLYRTFAVADGLEDVAPHGHVAGAMSSGGGHIAFNGVLDLERREFPPVLLGEQGKIGRRLLQGRRGRTRTFTVLPVAGGALALEHLRSRAGIRVFDRNLIDFLRRLLGEEGA